jgi:hypothetical protein
MSDPLEGSMLDAEDRPVAGEAALTVRMSLLDLVEIDAWAADQADRPSRAEAVRRLVRKALAIKVTAADHGLRPEELNAENDG